MGEVREEVLCSLQGRKGADGSFLFITPFRGFCSFFLMSVCRTSDRLVEKTARGAIIKGVGE